MDEDNRLLRRYAIAVVASWIALGIGVLTIAALIRIAG